MAHHSTLRHFGVVSIVLFFSLFTFESKSQARLTLSQSNSTVNGTSYSEVQNPVFDPDPNCHPPESIYDAGNQFNTFGGAPDWFWGGAYTYIKRGLPNCKISAQGTGNLQVRNDNSSTVYVQWWCHSNTQYDCYDPDCSWHAIDTSTVTGHIVLNITGVPDGTPVEVSYRWEHFSSIASESEAASEDAAEIHNASLNLFNEVGFGAGMDLSGNTKFSQKRTGDSIQTINKVAGDSLIIDVSALTLAYIFPPPYTPTNPREDDASADFFGFVYISVNAPGNPNTITDSCPVPLLLYSVDIGSDVEISDPTPNSNEQLDPGDLYVAGSASLVPFFNDSLVFNAEPNPSVGNPAGTCFPGPMQQWQHVLNFDLDGVDRVDYDLYSNISNYGLGKPSIPFYSTDCIYSPAYMLVSYDEDRGINFSSAVNCNVPSSFSPVDSVLVKGTTNGHDEVMSSNLTYNYSTGMYNGVAMPYKNEVEVSSLLSPSPPSIQLYDANDDVDALDLVSDPAACSHQYFSVDHEAHYKHGTDTLRPGFIYQLISNGNIQAVVHPILHMGLSNTIDIDAFEFAWLWDTAQHRYGLALVFSVSVNDPFDGNDFTGGLDPGALYASFLNGTYFEMLPSIKPGNIDAVTFACKPFVANGSVYTPPTPISTSIDKLEEQPVVLQLYPNPNNGNFTLEFSLNEKSMVSTSVRDVNGRAVWQGNSVKLQKGVQHLQVPVPLVADGLYFVELCITRAKGTQVVRKKFQVMR